MILNLPNQITISRLLLAAVCLVLLSQFSALDPDQQVLYRALAVFIIAALTDWLDGYVAQQRSQVTSLGRILDPFVDKVLICGTFLVYSSSGFTDGQGHNITGISAWMVVVIIGSELLVSGLASFCESHGQGMTISWLGKAKMCIQATCAGWVMLFVAVGHHNRDQSILSQITTMLVWITVVVTALSGLNYLYQTRQTFFKNV